MRRFATFFFLLFTTAPAHASVVLALSVDDMVRRSDLVVLGHVLSVQTSWASDHRHIYRRVVVGAEESWKGTSANEVAIVVAGGEIDGVGEKVVGVPSFTEGMRGVFFLERTGSAYRVIGLSQGFFESSAQGLVQHTDELALVHPSATGYRLSPHGAEVAPARSIANLRAEVRAAVESRPAAP